MKKWILYIVICLMGLVGCTQDIPTKDMSLGIRFSNKEVFFDTVFTTIGSSTQRVMVYNPNKNAVVIKQVMMDEGKYFRINLDGENITSAMKDITLRGGDSLFLFLKATINPVSGNSPVLITDTIRFFVGDGVYSLPLQAIGQNVSKIQGRNGLYVGETLDLTNRLPYLIFDTIAISGTIHIDSGATLYMHSGAVIYAYGDVEANGTLTQPILIRGDRTDRLFDSVPYRVASGQWNGIYLLHAQGDKVPTYTLNHVEVEGGTIGIYAYSETTNERSRMVLSNARIHNHSAYGLVLQNVDATVWNTEISNAASYCVYLAGGEQMFVHCTIASYFGYPYSNLNIHTTSRDDVAAVYINNLSKEMAPTTAQFKNCIITGARKNNLVVATPLPQHYPGEICGNYLQADSLKRSWAHNNVYHTDSDSCVFRNIYYRYKEYKYYDFRLDSLSPARGIADSIVSLSYPYDRLGHRRKAKADAGCYEY